MGKSIEFQLETDQELRLLINALYYKRNEGMEAIRLFDRAMTALENAAHIEYDEFGNVVYFQRATDENGKIIYQSNGQPMQATDEAGEPIAASTIGDDPTVRFEKCSEWVRARMESYPWHPSETRKALRLMERMGIVDDEED